MKRKQKRRIKAKTRMHEPGRRRRKYEMYFG
jgi:hypothetical protein